MLRRNIAVRRIRSRKQETWIVSLDMSTAGSYRTRFQIPTVIQAWQPLTAGLYGPEESLLQSASYVQTHLPRNPSFTRRHKGACVLDVSIPATWYRNQLWIQILSTIHACSTGKSEDNAYFHESVESGTPPASDMRIANSPKGPEIDYHDPSLRLGLQPKRDSFRCTQGFLESLIP